MENLTVVPTNFWPWIIANLSIVLIIFFFGKSNGCCKNFSGLEMKCAYYFTVIDMMI